MNNELKDDFVYGKDKRMTGCDADDIKKYGIEDALIAIEENIIENISEAECLKKEQIELLKITFVIKPNGNKSINVELIEKNPYLEDQDVKVQWAEQYNPSGMDKYNIEDKITFITEKVALAIGERKNAQNEPVEITKINWNVKRPRGEKIIKVEFLRKKLYKKEEIKNYYSELIKLMGGRVVECEIGSGKTPSVNLVATVPNEFKESLQRSGYQRMMLKEAFFNAVPVLDGEFSCIIDNIAI